MENPACASPLTGKDRLTLFLSLWGTSINRQAARDPSAEEERLLLLFFKSERRTSPANPARSLSCPASLILLKTRFHPRQQEKKKKIRNHYYKKNLNLKKYGTFIHVPTLRDYHNTSRYLCILKFQHFQTN
jgi:hypothetical protein